MSYILVIISTEYKISKGNSVLHLGVFPSVRGYHSACDKSFFFKFFVSPQVATLSHINLDGSCVHSDSAVPEDRARRTYQIYIFFQSLGAYVVECS